MFFLSCLVFSCAYPFLWKFYDEILKRHLLTFFLTDWRHMRRKNIIEISSIYWNVLLWIFQTPVLINFFIPLSRWLHDPSWPGEIQNVAGITTELWTLNEIYPAITCEKFHPGKMWSLFCTAGFPPCLDKIFLCNRFNPPKRNEKVN